MVVPSITFVYDRRGQASNKKQVAVELKITANGERKFISTGVKLYPKEWKNGSVIGRKDWREVNDQLASIHKRVSEIVTKMIDEGNLDLGAIPNLLRDGVVQGQTFIEYVKDCTKIRTRGLADGTKKRYKVVIDFLESWKGIVHFADLTEMNLQKMDECLEERGLKENSRYNYHKIVKAFVRMALDDGLIKRNPYSRLKIGRGDNDGEVRHLTPEEFHRFESCVIPTESLRRIRDVFVFQTYTMMGYCDLKAFDPKKCVKVKGQDIYKSKRGKTGQEFTVVILPQAKAILKKYRNKLPILSDQKYNMYLKAAVLYAKIDKPVTSHWARHTGATMLLNEGKVPIHIIQHILGHATLRETERTYAKLLDYSIVDEMVKYQRKLG